MISAVVDLCSAWRGVGREYLGWGDVNLDVHDGHKTPQTLNNTLLEESVNVHSF